MMMMMMMSLAVTGWVDLCLSVSDSDDWSLSLDPTDRQNQRREVTGDDVWLAVAVKSERAGLLLYHGRWWVFGVKLIKQSWKIVY